MSRKRLIRVFNLILAGSIFLSACQANQLDSEPTPLSATDTATPPSPTPIPPTATLNPIELALATQAAIPTITPNLAETEMARMNPPSQGYVALAYDIESDRVLLFGGQTGTIDDMSGETWAFDPQANQWSRMNPSEAPSARGAALMAYDSESDKVILFGGFGGNVQSDTWAYDFNTDTWSNLSKGPNAGIGAQMAYDTESDRIILFGGWANSFRDGTWAYDFNTDTWTEMEPDLAPTARNFHAMTYEPGADRIVLWGGDVDAPRGDSSVWAYDYNSNTWEEHIQEGDKPSTREYSAMVYDADTERIVVYGGKDTGRQDTWTYDYAQNTWTNMEPEENPGRLSRHDMVYVPSTSRIILFGGQIGDVQFNYTSSTWAYDSAANTWSDVTPQP